MAKKGSAISEGLTLEKIRRAAAIMESESIPFPYLPFLRVEEKKLLTMAKKKKSKPKKPQY